MTKAEMFNKINLDTKMSIQTSRETLRFGLNILVSIIVVCYTCLCIYIQSLPIFILVISITFLVYMYADYIPHSLMYAKIYDSIKNKDTRGNALRGLAEIYLDEYKLTKLNRKNDIYKQIDKYEFENNNVQDICLKYILWMQADNIKCPDIINSIILLAINIYLTIPNALETFMYVFAGVNPNEISFKKVMVAISVNFVFAIINIYTSIQYKSQCKQIKNIARLIKTNNKKKRFKAFYKYNKKMRRKYDIIKARGKFVFCSSYISKGKSLDEIPLKYRMLFIHKYYANIPRFWITILLSSIALLMILLQIHVTSLTIIIFMAIIVMVTILFRILVLPKIGEYRIVKQCEIIVNEN